MIYITIYLYEGYNFAQRESLATAASMRYYTVQFDVFFLVPPVSCSNSTFELVQNRTLIPKTNRNTDPGRLGQGAFYTNFDVTDAGNACFILNPNLLFTYMIMFQITIDALYCCKQNSKFVWVGLYHLTCYLSGGFLP